MRLALAVLLLCPPAIAPQDASSLRERIEGHYRAIHAGDNETVFGHHLPEMTLFPESGHLLMEAGWASAPSEMGAEIPFAPLQVAMRHFSAQIYGDVGVATFYLDGLIDGERATSRVSAVWVWRDGRWLEAHHHESRLIS